MGGRGLAQDPGAITGLLKIRVLSRAQWSAQCQGLCDKRDIESHVIGFVLIKPLRWINSRAISLLLTLDPHMRYVKGSSLTRLLK